METTKQKNLTPYLTFDREQWSELRNNVPLTLTEQDLKPLLGLNENLSLDEVSTIFLPLVRLINYYIEENIRRQNVLHNFLGIKLKTMPYIIGIAGSVASGKSTTSRILQTILSQWPNRRKVDLVTTDGFLYDMNTLVEKNLMNRKGFPESYNMHKLLRFIYDVKSGKRHIKVPLYSQLTYDIIPNQHEIVDQPDILILEGLNILQDNTVNLDSDHLVFVSDFVDFSIYVDASEKLLEKWFLERFLKLRDVAFKDPNSYFHSYTLISAEEAIVFAKDVWKNINGLNLQENILPTRERADLILTKGENHTIDTVKLKK
ncbi:MAG: type I pantothenate kinase [Neisseriaceae bacterium]|nr:MAG: type I pantothenate kinase [Neisseriaceae bacterium]